MGFSFDLREWRWTADREGKGVPESRSNVCIKSISPPGSFEMKWTESYKGTYSSWVPSKGRKSPGAADCSPPSDSERPNPKSPSSPSSSSPALSSELAASFSLLCCLAAEIRHTNCGGRQRKAQHYWYIPGTDWRLFFSAVQPYHAQRAKAKAENTDQPKHTSPFIYLFITTYNKNKPTKKIKLSADSI